MIKNISLLVASIAVSLLLGEALVRATLDADDFLTPLLRSHPQFNTMIAPNSAGHDKWGFRNDAVPEKADLLTLGDSFTYGYLASKENTWPSIVGRQTGLKVYNVSMGGWGPSQYLCALKVYGRTLKPKFVAVAVYLGNDIGQAATEDYACDELDPDRVSAGGEVLEFADDGPLRGVRTWLARNSVLYQLIKTTLNESAWFAGVSVAGYPNIYLDSSTGTTVALRIFPQESATNSECDLGHGTQARPFDWRACDAQFQHGTKTIIEQLTAMKQECEQIGATCLTVLIPSKEAIYYPLVSESVPPKIAQELVRERRNEEAAGDAIASAFAGSDMLIVKSEREFQDAIRAGDEIFPVSADPHFNPKGYEIVGDLVSTQLKASPGGSAVTAAR